MTLPTEKQQPAADGILYRRALLSGAQKLGKTVTGIGYTPKPLIIDSEGSAEGYECYRAPCPDWPTFRKIGADLAADPERGGFTALVLDTADELARLCQETVISSLAGRDNDMDAGSYHHPSDFGFGKGWDAVAEEFRLRVGKLCSLGLPVLFISHEKEQEVTGRTGTRTVFSPDVGNKKMRGWLLGFVDVILRAAVVPVAEGGDRHVIIARPSADNVVGGRTPEGAAALPPMFSLSGEALTRALSARAEMPKSVEPETPQAVEQQPEGKPAEGEPGNVQQLPIEGEKSKQQSRKSRTGAKAA